MPEVIVIERWGRRLSVRDHAAERYAYRVLRRRPDGATRLALSDRLASDEVYFASNRPNWIGHQVGGAVGRMERLMSGTQPKVGYVVDPVQRWAMPVVQDGRPGAGPTDVAALTCLAELLPLPKPPKEE